MEFTLFLRQSRVSEIDSVAIFRFARCATTEAYCCSATASACAPSTGGACEKNISKPLILLQIYT
eukprot:1070668-Prorocentrum_minimum.AAC.3